MNDRVIMDKQSSQKNHMNFLEPVKEGVHHNVMESFQLYWAQCILERNRRAMNTPTVVAVEQLRSNDVVFALSKDAKYKKVIEKFVRCRVIMIAWQRQQKHFRN